MQQIGIAPIFVPSLAAWRTLTIMDRMSPPRLLGHNFVRALLFAAGCVLLVVGIAGLVLPLLPGTVFLIIAAACFARSSPRFENWLITHPQFGPSIVAWRKTGTIPLYAKLLSIGAMLLSFGFVALSAPGSATAITGTLMAAAGLYVVTRPTTRP
jgi:uncharacterized membrane protein YbaN (DUF454 family)